MAVIHEGVESDKLKKEPLTLDCEECGKKFTHPSNLRTHFKTIHEGERNHQCNLCGNRFAQKGQMQRHKVRIHSLESRPNPEGGLIHQCDRCGEKIFNLSKVCVIFCNCNFF